MCLGLTSVACVPLRIPDTGGFEISTANMWKIFELQKLLFLNGFTRITTNPKNKTVYNYLLTFITYCFISQQEKIKLKSSLSAVYFNTSTCFFSNFSASRIARMATGMVSRRTKTSIGVLSITGRIRAS